MGSRHLVIPALTDLRLRLAARMLLAGDGLRVSEFGRTQMLAELASTGPDQPDSQSGQPL
jgi:hypothetical protein